jgi:hypothetical protein
VLPIPGMAHAADSLDTHTSWYGTSLILRESREPALNDPFLKMYLKMRDLTTREEGQDLVEHALLITLVALAAVVA